MNTRNTLLALCFFLCSHCLRPAPCLAQGTFLLPETFGEWKAEAEYATPLKTASDDLGKWEDRLYVRTAPLARVEVLLMEGSGPGTLRVPPAAASDEGKTPLKDTPIGFGATYETLTVAGLDAILEHEDLTGYALAVKLDKNQTLTVESKSLSREELLNFAERIIAEGMRR